LSGFIVADLFDVDHRFSFEHANPQKLKRYPMTNHPIPGHMNFLPSKEDLNEKQVLMMWLMESSTRQYPYMRNLGTS